jgi:hypothetical protein
MPKQSKVTIAAGAGFTDVPATIPSHQVQIWPDSDRNAAAMEYKVPDDNFTATFTTDASLGDILQFIAPGDSLLGYPAAFSASLQAAFIYAKIRFADGVSRDVIRFES